MSNLWQRVAGVFRSAQTRLSLGPFEPEVSSAVGDWSAGIFVGLTPLIAHAVLYLFVRPVEHWTDGRTETWTGEILFFTITNSGLSLVTLIARLRRGSIALKGTCSLFGGLTLVIFFIAVLIYGAVASGSARGIALPASIFIGMASAVLSLYFEMTLVSKTA